VLFDEGARGTDPRAPVGAALARGLAGDLEGARRRLHEALDARPDDAGAYLALGVLCLRERDPLAHAQEAAFALVAARDLCPGVGCVERTLAQALATTGEFMGALQSARVALALDPDDLEARLWSALLRLYFGGDTSAATLLQELSAEADAAGRCAAVWLPAVAGAYAVGEFHTGRSFLRRAVAPLRPSDPAQGSLADGVRRWHRELRGFGPGVPMAPSRWLRDVGGPQSEYARTRAALMAYRETLSHRPVLEDPRVPGPTVLAVEGLLGELEARTRRAMLAWGARLLVRGFAEAYLPLVALLEAPAPELIAAMGLVVCDG
jgi:tetratricopeptide (TPR) repeat protein